MAKIVYSPEAKDDMVGIKSYIENDLLNPSASERVLIRIAKKIRLLETAPQIGTPLSSVIPLDTNYRFLVAGNYMAFYRYMENDNTCYVDRVLYCKRNYISILFGEISDQDEKTDDE